MVWVLGMIQKDNLSQSCSLGEHRDPKLGGILIGKLRIEPDILRYILSGTETYLGCDQGAGFGGQPDDKIGRFVSSMHLEAMNPRSKSQHENHACTILYGILFRMGLNVTFLEFVERKTSVHGGFGFLGVSSIYGLPVHI